jgi:hypothetical protein
MREKITSSIKRVKITSSIKRVARRCKMNAFWKGKTAYKATDAYEIPDDVVKSALIDGLDSSWTD